MTTIFDSAAPVKSDCRPFGTLPARERRQPYTLQDLRDAAQMFGDIEADRRFDEQAAESTWYDQFNDTIPLTGHCLNCGVGCDDLTKAGLCDACDTIAVEDSIACVNQLHGLGRRVF